MNLKSFALPETDGSMLELTDEEVLFDRPAHSADSATYICLAFNPSGAVNRTVSVSVVGEKEILKKNHNYIYFIKNCICLVQFFSKVFAELVKLLYLLHSPME